MNEPESSHSQTEGTSQTWQPLTLLERRIVGVLVEKAKTVPDSYPLTLNGLINGCNQKSNRDPLMDVSDAEIEEVLPNLKKMGLVQQILGSGRTDKYRHILYEAWKVDKVELAILTELLLRGPQTEGELRTRASRMEPIADLDALRTVIQALVAKGMVIYLTPPERRGSILTHNFYPAEELAKLKSRVERSWEDSGTLSSPSPATSRSNSDLENRVATLEKTVAELQAQLTVLIGK